MRSADAGRRHRPKDDTGSTLAGAVLALVVLGALAAGAVVAVDNLTSVAGPVGRARNPITAAAVVSCQIDRATVEQAESAYQAATRHQPASVAALATRDPATGLGPWLKEAPSSTRYMLVIDPTTGAIAVQDPAGHRVAGCAALG